MPGKRSYYSMKIVRESISFERGKDPKSAMGIGIEGAIKNWYKEEHDAPELGDQIILDILEDNELERDVKAKWVRYLISKGYRWDYEEFSEMVGWSIDFTDVIPDGWRSYILDFEVFKKNDQFYVEFSDWGDWAQAFDTDNDTSPEFIQSVLSGDDSFPFFETFGEYEYSAQDAIHIIESNLQKIPSYSYLEDLYIEMGGNKKNLGDVEAVISDIWEDSDFDKLKNSIELALDEASMLASENAAYKDIKRELDDHFDIGREIWDEKNNTFTVPISEDGFMKLLNISFEGEDRIYYRSPDYGYIGDPRAEDFDQALESQLSNIS